MVPPESPPVRYPLIELFHIPRENDDPLPLRQPDSPTPTQLSTTDGSTVIKFFGDSVLHGARSLGPNDDALTIESRDIRSNDDYQSRIDVASEASDISRSSDLSPLSDSSANSDISLASTDAGTNKDTTPPGRERVGPNRPNEAWRD
jgi:hypothetical protein